MSQRQPGRPSPLIRALKKYSVSAFVVCSFTAYAAHERMIGADTSAASSGQAPVAVVREVTVPPAQVLPPAPPTSAPVALGAYKDGEYVGPAVDAYFGNVQVKATIRSGQIADVAFLAYPNHRRTSVRINNYVMPYLTSEAIQAQSARVNIISGATLTSEAFAESLQSALSDAKS